MSVLKYPRAILGLGLVGALFVTTLTASQRQAAQMATAANAFLAGLTPEQRQQAALPVRERGAHALELHPQRVFPRKGLMVKAMTEAAARPGARAAQDRPEPARLHDRDVDHGSRERAAGDRGGGRRQRPQQLRARSARVLLLDLRHAGGEGDLGLARRRPSHLAALHGRGRQGGRQRRRRSSAPTRRRCRDGPKKGLRVLGAEEDAGRALLLALDDAQRATAMIPARRRATSSPATSVAVDPAESRPGITAAAMTPPQRDLLMKLIDVYTSYMAEDAAAERLAKLEGRRRRQDRFAWAARPSRARSTTTACRARRS